MPEVIAIYSTSSTHYHNNSECPERAKIKRGVRFGTGGKKICPECEKLNAEGK